MERQLANKLRDPVIGSLLNQAEEQGLSLVMVPRIQRAILTANSSKLPAQICCVCILDFLKMSNKSHLKCAETYFLQQTPQMGWGLTTAEVLTASHNTNYIQQKQVLKQHAQSHKSNEIRVRRRTLIEALFDLLAVKVVTGENFKQHCRFDRIESGRANMAAVNYGEGGIRISDINRQQAHPQLCLSYLVDCLPPNPPFTQCIQSPFETKESRRSPSDRFSPGTAHSTPSSEKSPPHSRLSAQDRYSIDYALSPGLRTADRLGQRPNRR